MSAPAVAADDRPRLLLVERDPALRAAVTDRLPTVDVREDDGRSDLAGLLSSHRPHVVVLELGGPSGVARLHDVRAVSDVRLIALLDRVVDCVEALDRGADDYLDKPLAPRELVAKIQSALRRTRRSRRPEMLECGPIVVDVESREIRVHGRRIDAPAREFDLLAHLASSPGRVFDRTALLREVWGASSEWLGGATVTEHVRRLRRRIEPDPCRPAHLQTVRGRGYRLVP